MTVPDTAALVAIEQWSLAGMRAGAAVLRAGIACVLVRALIP